MCKGFLDNLGIIPKAQPVATAAAPAAVAVQGATGAEKSGALVGEIPSGTDEGMSLNRGKKKSKAQAQVVGLGI